MLGSFVVANDSFRELARPVEVASTPEVPMRRTAWFLTALIVLGGVSACGDLTVAPNVPPPDTGDANLSDADTDAVVTDALPGDSTATSCQFDLDCSSMKGKTPCKLPSCDKGTCVLKLRLAGEVCVDPGEVVGECRESTCSAAGQCVVGNRPEATPCGVGACGKKCQGGECVPATAADYDDGNPCTYDYCDQGKQVVHAPITDASTACDDSDACTKSDACLAGKCTGQQVICNDGVSCTADSCVKASGCVYTPQASACSDGNPCTKDACDPKLGCIVAGNEMAKQCDDNNVCTINDLCKDGTCSGQPDVAKPECGCTTVADCPPPADLCAGEYVCNKVCMFKPGTAVVCDKSADTMCAKSTCDKLTGKCVMAPIQEGVACDDNDACTAETVCVKGTCASEKIVACDDGNTCTVDACDPQQGCVSTPTTASCNDGDSCTTGDNCATGVCQGSKKPCDDGVSCTFDECNPNTGSCKFTPDATLCADGNPCTLDQCLVSAKGCAYLADDSAKCDDGNACTKDACQGGKCVGKSICDCQADTDCNDNNPCTADTCDGGSCISSVAGADGKACSPVDKCQIAGSGVCQGGSCSGGKPLDCSGAGDACNEAICNPQTGTCETIGKADGTECSDGSGCTVKDACQGGKCIPGMGVACEDYAPCVGGTCKSTGATTYECAKAPKPPQTPCDDGNNCTQNDSCDGKGTCSLGAATLCPGDPCFDGVCDPVQGCIKQQKKPGSSCDDSLFCTTGNTCDAMGQCGLPTKCEAMKCRTAYCDTGIQACFSTPIEECCLADGDCNDGRPCTKDYCMMGACTHAPIKGCCNPTLWSAEFDDGSLHGMKIQNSTSPARGWQLWAKSPQSVSPPSALYYGDAKAGNYNWGIHSGTVETPVLALPTSKGIVFSFQALLAIEENPSYDQLFLYVVNPATGGKDQVWGKSSTTPNSKWFPVEIDLSAYAGQTVKLVFDFNTGDAQVNETLGIFLDNLMVTGPCLF